MPPGNLPSDHAFINYLGGSSDFMSDEDVAHWIESVNSPYLREWYQKYPMPNFDEGFFKLASRDNRDYLEFTREMEFEIATLHVASTSNGMLMECASKQSVAAGNEGRLNYREYTALITCLIVRYGLHGGEFAACEDQTGLHFAASLLLATVVVDVRQRPDGYFAQLLGAETSNLPDLGSLRISKGAAEVHPRLPDSRISSQASDLSERQQTEASPVQATPQSHGAGHAGTICLPFMPAKRT